MIKVNDLKGSLESVFYTFFNECVFLDGLIYCSQNSQVLFFYSKNNFKIESHDTIYIFKNYFVIVFSFFNNKRYPNKL